MKRSGDRELRGLKRVNRLFAVAARQHPTVGDPPAHRDGGSVVQRRIRHVQHLALHEPVKHEHAGRDYLRVADIRQPVFRRAVRRDLMQPVGQRRGRAAPVYGYRRAAIP